jgi:hypothetical protein
VPIYKVVVSAFQEIVVNAESEDEAKILAIKTGLDLSSAEWEIKDITPMRAKDEMLVLPEDN